MRLTVVITLILTLQATASVYSQATKMNMAMKNTTLEEVIDVIRDQSEFRFLYNHEEIAVVKDVNVNFDGATVEEILEKVLYDYDLDYKVVNKVVVITPAPGKTQRNIKAEVPAEQQKITFTGKVTDEDGNPVPFAAVVIKGTTRGAATDENGVFKFEVPEGDYVALVASSVGLISHQIEIGNNTYFEFVLRTDVAGLEEVLVTGYQTISKERSTGSYSIVKADDISSMETSLQGKLEGLATGVVNSTYGDANFMSSYLPDSDNDNRLIMRGISTMAENKSPLVVIDGFPSQEGLSSVNPNDIEQITFLKDAAAASIWGSQSSNGVIVITTKRGASSNKPKVAYKFSHQYLPKWDLDYLNKANSEEMVDFLDAELEDLPVAALNSFAPTELGYLMQDYKNGVIDEATYNAGLAELKARDNFGQIEDELLEVGAVQQHDLSIQGGSDKYNYRAAINYLRKSGGFKGNENDKINLSLNNDFKINERLKTSLGFNFIYEDVEYSPIFASEAGYFGRSVVVDRITPWEMLKDDAGNYLDQSRNYLGTALGLVGFFSTRQSQNILDNYGINTFSNILNDMNELERGYDSYLARLKAGFEYKIIEGLNFNGGFQYERGSRTNKSLWGKDSRIINGVRAAYTVTDWGGNITEQRVPDGAIQQVNTGDNFSYTARGTLNFRKEYNKHSITVLGGGEINRYFNEFYKNTQFGFNPNTLIEQPVDVRDLFGFIMPTLNGWGYTYGFGNLDTFNKITSRDDRYVSYFGNMGYTFDTKYVLTASGRIDNFNLYGGDTRFNTQPLWSLGAGWNISNEGFLDGATWLDYLKLAYTYGSNGNVARGAIPELQIRQAVDSEHGQISGQIVEPKNDGLKWEETKTNNLRADFGLFNSKLSGALDFYHRKSIDVLSGRELDPTHGLTRVTFNNGTIVNKGFEFELDAVLMQKNDFYWGARFLISYNHNEVVDIETSTRSQYPEDLLRGLYSTPGYPTNGIYSFQWVGLDENGHATVLDHNGEPSSSYISMQGTDMLEFSGSVIPSWVSSFTTQFRYKDFELSGMFVGNFGHVMRKDVPSIRLDEASRPHADVVNRWQEPGDEEHTDVPSIGTRFTEPPLADYLYTYADIHVVSASYIKLREVNLIYNVPQSLLSKLKLGPTQLMFQVNNAWKWTANDEGIDPEAHELAFGRRMMPIMTSYTFGINVNF